MKASIIIRVKNESDNLKKVLQILKEQTEQDFEIVIVDDNSTDGSEQVVFDYFPKNRIQIVNVPERKFTYPYASNLGAKKAKGRLLVYLSAHSFPISNTWLEDGLKHFSDKSIAGVFAIPLPHSDTNFIEKLTYNFTANYRHPKFKKYKGFRNGVLGATNAIIRKDLWKEHNFNEKWTRGGEDAEWASYFMEKGFTIIQDAKFRVRHSHHLTIIRLIKQYLYWKSLAAQRKFD